ncbi:hypothetical protein F4774DRAFT_204792 [Daldinia eschscholtzii]|nr:hypothetical protein F4774DRAFT_204792 [Daldinia eschscholtzii]
MSTYVLYGGTICKSYGKAVLSFLSGHDAHQPGIGIIQTHSHTRAQSEPLRLGRGLETKIQQVHGVKPILPFLLPNYMDFLFRVRIHRAISILAVIQCNATCLLLLWLRLSSSITREFFGRISDLSRLGLQCCVSPVSQHIDCHCHFGWSNFYALTGRGASPEQEVRRPYVHI